MLALTQRGAHAPTGAAKQNDGLPHSANHAGERYAGTPADTSAHREGAGNAPEVLPEGVCRRWTTDAELAAFVEGVRAGADGAHEIDNPYLVETPSGWAWLSGLRWIGAAEG